MTGSRLRLVLVVDDEPPVREILCAILREEGLEVLSAEAPRQALEMLDDRMPDLILTDLRMPGMDGCRFIETVRERFADYAPPAILVSATPSITRADRALFVSILRKPFHLGELAAAIAAVRELLAARPRRARSGTRLAAVTAETPAAEPSAADGRDT